MILLGKAAVNANNVGSNGTRPRTADALENHCGGNVTVGSNPTPSARPPARRQRRARPWQARASPAGPRAGKSL